MLAAVAGIRPGDVIAGKFRVERVLGEGGMGYVVAARHLQLGQMVALKFMREEIITPDYKSRFLREARNTVRLKSKHVARVLDVGSLDPDPNDARAEKGAPYMVMEYLEGTDLSDLLHTSGPPAVHDACEYVLQACQAIAEAHGHGIIHRDLKPANLFLTRGQSGEPVVKVLDFGVSKALDLGTDEETNPGGRPKNGRIDSVVTKVSDLLGSPSYMAPEQVVSARDADARSDIWSLGVILFRLISGKAPFHGQSLGELIQLIMHSPIPNLRDVKPDLPPGLELVVARCIERDRTQRLGDVIELARLLAPYAGPVATPSLERIAILGPALLAVVPAHTLPSAPSLHSRHSASAWTTPPQRASLPPPDKKELSPATAAIWGAVFVFFVAVSALAVAHFARSSAPPATAVALPPAVDAPPSPTIVPAAPTDSIPTFVPASLPAAASAKPIRRPPTGRPARPGQTPQGEIPATRE